MHDKQGTGKHLEALEVFKEINKNVSKILKALLFVVLILSGYDFSHVQKNLGINYSDQRDESADREQNRIDLKEFNNNSGEKAPLRP